MIELIKSSRISIDLKMDMQGIEEILMYIKELNNKNVKSPKILYSGNTRNLEIELDTDVDELIISKDVVKLYMDGEELEYLEERLKDALISRCFYPAEVFEKNIKTCMRPYTA
ncbi:MAG: hypothetical protein K2H41_10730 [Acetatifactor sp.]|nr:hypothetical protein [Acetatifactor sp.]